MYLVPMSASFTLIYILYYESRIYLTGICDYWNSCKWLIQNHYWSNLILFIFYLLVSLMNLSYEPVSLFLYPFSVCLFVLSWSKLQSYASLQVRHRKDKQTRCGAEARRVVYLQHQVMIISLWWKDKVIFSRLSVR